MQHLSTLAVVRSLIVVTLLSAAASHASAQRYVDSSGKIRNYTSSGISAGGSYSLLAKAFDSRDNPTVEEGQRIAAYEEPPFTDFIPAMRRSGPSFVAKASVGIETFTRQNAAGNFLADGWNSSFTSARITGAAGLLPESASAQSRVTDPKGYTVGAGETAVTFGLAFTAGTHMDAGAAGPGAFAATAMWGSQGTDLLADYDSEAPANLFTYSWNASTATPGSSAFTFISNPALGLDDNAIVAAFMANLTGADGEFTLMSDFAVEVSLAVSEGAMYQYGGVTEYDAEASCVPAPGCGALAGLATIIMGRRRSRSEQ